MDTVLLAFTLLTCLGVFMLLVRKPGQQLQAVEKRLELAERLLRDDLAASRKEMTQNARENRDELGSALKAFGDSVFRQMTEMAMLQKTQLELLTRATEDKLGRLQLQINADASQHREETANSLKAFSDSFRSSIHDFNEQQRQKFSMLTEQLEKLILANEQKMSLMRETLEVRLKELQQDNAQKLEKIRETVDEKLQSTLEKRLGDSFRQVSERLEQVHKGLGEMQTLASGVGDLKKALVNVKVRGTLGEIQLENILEQVFTREQYDKNVAVRPQAAERVEFAIKMPGKDADSCVWLPIDSKFPLEDYHRLLDAYECTDTGQMESCAKQLENSIKKCAKDIRDKYISPPHTTDFGIMFLPFEGLYSEILRRNGLFESLMRDYKVAVTGPTTLAAFLNSLQMGFRTLTIEKRSSEVWALLGSVKAEFGQFGALLDKTKKKLQEASNTIDGAAQKSRTIERKLKDVQGLPDKDTDKIIPALNSLETEDIA